MTKTPDRRAPRNGRKQGAIIATVAVAILGILTYLKDEVASGLIHAWVAFGLAGTQSSANPDKTDKVLPRTDILHDLVTRGGCFERADGSKLLYTPGGDFGYVTEARSVAGHWDQLSTGEILASARNHIVRRDRFAYVGDAVCLLDMLNHVEVVKPC